MKLAILIPAYNPDTKLTELCDKLHAMESWPLVIVDDGSLASSSPVFTELKTRENIHVLVHEENKGKGAALKTGFEYILKSLPGCELVITADADGQHAPEDIRDLGQVGEAQPDSLILGVRDLSQMPAWWKFI